MVTLWGETYSRMELLRRVGDISQLAGAQAFELVDGGERGCRGVWLRNTGLEFTVITDRGMGITNLSYLGVSLAFLTGLGAIHPAYAEHVGLGWLRTWPAGFLTTCGLTQVGSPSQDGNEQLGQHGRATHLPARNVAWGGEWKGEDYWIWVEGTLHEAAFFGDNVLLRRRIGMRLGEPRLWIEDRVQNQSFNSVPHMYLQHFNLGFPLVDGSTRLELPERSTQPRDEQASLGLETCCEFSGPQAGFREQVYYHDLKPDERGQVELRLVNPDFAGGRGLRMAMRYAKSDYPILVEWKMMGEGAYVLGLEPSNCHVEGRMHERELGTLQMLAPQEERTYFIEIDFS